jgi:GNAT superfamily N-acetyltransferase
MDKAILISDLLLNGKRVAMPTPFARACAAQLPCDRVGTIAVTQYPRRGEDIDRTITPTCNANALEHVLSLILARLDYLGVPEKRAQLLTHQVVVRPLKPSNEAEFRKYFKLRQKIYTIMGYLDEETEHTKSGLEANEADTHAIHLGAFLKDEVREALIGTARIVTNVEVDESIREMLRAMAGEDRKLKKRLDTPYDLTLPVFQSHRRMTGIMTEILKKDQVCGELSRVIVDLEYRGNGISRRLVDLAVQTAARAGVNRLFLECLPSHEQIYERHGFRKLDGIKGTVIDVRRTMIAMELNPTLIEELRHGAVSRIGQQATQIPPNQMTA